MPITPSAGYVLVKDKTNTNVGRFSVANDGQKESMVGEVIACGDDKREVTYKENTKQQMPISGGKSTRLTECPCKVGDTIVYPKYHSNSFTWEGEEYKLIDFNNIIGVIE
jgi:co-chaperonin GroES (HSP10)